MLSAETRAIAASLRAALARAARPSARAGSFRELDTFCPATQRRQDAVRRMIEERALDRLIVVGGFRSSNTAHLARIGQARVPTYHVEDAGCLIDARHIRHLPHGATEPVVSTGWLPPAPAHDRRDRGRLDARSGDRPHPGAADRAARGGRAA